MSTLIENSKWHSVTAFEHSYSGLIKLAAFRPVSTSAPDSFAPEHLVPAPRHGSNRDDLGRAADQVKHDGPLNNYS